MTMCNADAATEEEIATIMADQVAAATCHFQCIVKTHLEELACNLLSIYNCMGLRLQISGCSIVGYPFDVLGFSFHAFIQPL